MSYHYWSIQYSAIQKLILRHDRLWSMAGISMGLASLNEVKLVKITRNYQGIVLVAGGGKFTARFKDKTMAEEARNLAVNTIAQRFPMLEFQVSPEPITASSLEAAKAEGLINVLNEQKRCFRGYGLTFNPHLQVCEECSEYPATIVVHHRNSKGKRCALCSEAHTAARHVLQDIAGQKEKDLTTVERIYRTFLGETEADNIKVPLDFDDLFPGSRERERNRLGVWFSDINSMNDKVPLWLTRPVGEEDQIKVTFDQVKQVNIDIIAAALRSTFPSSRQAGTLPFRIVIAGGDDLCIVMAEEFILAFTVNLDKSLHTIIEEKEHEENHPLNKKTMEAARIKYNKGGKGKTIKKNKPYSFGASFVVCSQHTPFSRIHQVGEKLMSLAKQESGRYGNAVHWAIMAEEEAESSRLFDFEKPVFIDKSRITGPDAKESPAWGRLDFSTLLTLRGDFSSVRASISSSHRFQIVEEMMKHKGDSAGLQRRLRILDSTEADKSFSGLLREHDLLDEDGIISSKRLASLFELMSIKGRVP